MSTIPIGVQAERVRLAIDQDNLEYHQVDESDVYNTITAFYGGETVGYSHRGGGRQPIPIVLGLSKSNNVVDERALPLPVAGQRIPGGTGVVELGDVVHAVREKASYPIFRHNGRTAEMVTARSCRQPTRRRSTACSPSTRPSPMPTGATCPSRRSRCTASPTTRSIRRCCGTANGR